MTYNKTDHSVSMGVREAIAWLVSLSAAAAALSTWFVLPHRLSTTEKLLEDHEARIRVLERIDSQLSEVRADLKVIRMEIRRYVPPAD